MTEPRDQNRFLVRMPDGMRDRIKDEAEKSGRSMNAEIVVRLEHSLEGAFVDLTGVGFAAMVLRLEAMTESLNALFFSLRDGLPVVDEVMRERDMDRETAVRWIVEDWARQRERAEE